MSDSGKAPTLANHGMGGIKPSATDAHLGDGSQGPIITETNCIAKVPFAKEKAMMAKWNGNQPGRSPFPAGQLYKPAL